MSSNILQQLDNGQLNAVVKQQFEGVERRQKGVTFAIN